jgi:hypothetical protein
MALGETVRVKTHLGEEYGTIVGFVVKLNKTQYERIDKTDHDYEYVVTGIENEKMYELHYIVTDGEILTTSAAAGGGQGGGKRKRQSRKTRKNRK